MNDKTKPAPSTEQHHDKEDHYRESNHEQRGRVFDEIAKNIVQNVMPPPTKPKQK